MKKQGGYGGFKSLIKKIFRNIYIVLIFLIDRK